MSTTSPESARLTFRRVTGADMGVLHGLVIDPHVRQYLMDGETHDRSWIAERIAESDSLFAAQQVGLWLAFLPDVADAIGFCGFLAIPDAEGPQLVYALRRWHTGKGYGSEMAEATVRFATGRGFRALVTSVDGPNTASVRILEKLGFRQSATKAGAFGTLLQYRLEVKPAPNSEDLSASSSPQV